MKITVPSTAMPNRLYDELNNNELSTMFYFIKATNNIPSNTVHISQSDLMKNIKIANKNTFKNIINHLEELNYITVKHNSPIKNQKAVANEYTVNYDKINMI